MFFEQKRFITAVMTVWLLGAAQAALGSLIITPASTGTGTEGSSSTFNLGSFTDTNSGPYNLTVTWGDGSANTQVNGVSQGSLSAQHNYGEEGTYSITVGISDSVTSGSAMLSANINDPSVMGTGASFSAFQGMQFSNVVVATFTDPAPAEPNTADPAGTIANHYSASIGWGDGTFTAGTITLSSGTFSVAGSHTYSAVGLFFPSITVLHESSQSALLSGGTVTVSSTPEPSDFLLFGSGIAGFAGIAWTRRRRRT
jgi:hypothetical protein